jgi:excinuclease UvrABC ATPase subunit
MPCECQAPRPDIFPARRRAAGHGLEETRSVRGWDRRNAHFFQLILSLAAHYGFDVDAPWESLPKDVQQAVMYGSGKEKIAFRYPTERGGKVTREHPFEGILPNLDRRYKETESAAVREAARSRQAIHAERR